MLLNQSLSEQEAPSRVKMSNPCALIRIRTWEIFWTTKKRVCKLKSRGWELLYFTCWSKLEALPKLTNFTKYIYVLHNCIKLPCHYTFYLHMINEFFSMTCTVYFTLLHRRRHPSLNVVFTGQFYLGWWINFVGSESSQKQSVKLLQNMVYNTTKHPHPPTATHCLYIL
jgi:hypothetical protein